MRLGGARFMLAVSAVNVVIGVTVAWVLVFLTDLEWAWAIAIVLAVLLLIALEGAIGYGMPPTRQLPAICRHGSCFKTGRISCERCTTPTLRGGSGPSFLAYTWLGMAQQRSGISIWR